MYAFWPFIYMTKFWWPENAHFWKWRHHIFVFLYQNAGLECIMQHFSNFSDILYVWTGSFWQLYCHTWKKAKEIVSVFSTSLLCKRTLYNDKSFSVVSLVSDVLAAGITKREGQVLENEWPEERNDVRIIKEHEEERREKGAEECVEL